MKGICPNCEKETELELVCTKEVVEVRGEPIEVDTEFFKCTECGVDFENTQGPDAIVLAYQEYRHRHDMLQPHQIRDRRKQYGLTQNELSQILGWGGVTLSRYENGALHSEAHEKILRLAMEPHNLITLIEEAPGAILEDKRKRLLDELRATDSEACSFERLFEEQLGQYAPDEFSGFRKLDSKKLFNAILFFSVGGQLKTKLNKLLFYADFKHFKEYSVSITGARYVHLQYGPVPDDYDYYFAELAREHYLGVEEEIFDNYTGFKCVARVEPDLSLFNQSERDVLEQVIQYFRHFGSVKIMEFSHEEVAYASTMEGETISYLHAGNLRI
ncbi:MAG: type II TA system antitoxin MqsA family protein [Thiotrichaceae bacterium]